jgi:hypothetical protein
MFCEIDQIFLFLAGEDAAFELGFRSVAEQVQHEPGRGAFAGETFPEPSEEHRGDGGGNLLGIDRLAQQDEMVASRSERAGSDRGDDVAQDGIALEMPAGAGPIVVFHGRVMVKRKGEIRNSKLE